MGAVARPSPYSGDMSNDVYFGNMIHETVLKRGLKELCPDVHFDMAAALNIWHPRIDEWQGIYVNGRHVGSMDRGSIPEFTIYELIGGLPDKALRIGWRDMLHQLTKRHVDGFTWPNFCRVFGVEYKQFVGKDSELHTDDARVVRA